jgi:hypothetical protein
MFIGHFGLGLAAKKVAPKPSLGTLFLASQLIDLIWPFLLLFGLETVRIDLNNTAVTPLDFVYYPFSHSMLAVLLYGVGFAAVYYLIRRDIKSSIWLGILVFSHWILDLITHRPDLPLSFDQQSIKVGMGLWNSIFATIFFEGLIFGAGIFLYLQVTRAKDKTGIYAFWALIVFLIIIYFNNLFGPPPPSAEPIGYVGLAQWLLIIWAYWIGRHREIR